MSKAPRGRRVRPTARPRSARPAGDFDAIDGLDLVDETPGASETLAEAAVRTRAQNRAKRAASGVRPKAVRGGQVRGRRASNAPLLALAVAAVAVGVAVILLGNPFGTPGASASPCGSLAVGLRRWDPPDEPARCARPRREPPRDDRDREGRHRHQGRRLLSPIAAGNFVALAECKFYDGVVFHRTAAPRRARRSSSRAATHWAPARAARATRSPTSRWRRPTSAARSRWPAPGPDSQGSQFFIVLSDEAGPILQSANTYAIFGNVVSGLEVADAIFQASGGAELPASSIEMTSVTVGDVPASPSPAPQSPRARPRPRRRLPPPPPPRRQPATHEEHAMTRATIATEIGDIEIDLYTQAALKGPELHRPRQQGLL